MSRGRGKSGSELGYILALSPTTVSGAASSDAFNVGNYNFGTIGLLTVSTAMSVNLEGSNASDSGFTDMGCSLVSGSPTSNLVVRSFKVGGSNKYIRAIYNIEGGGSALTSIFLVMDEAYKTPVDQHTNTTVYSSIV